MNLVLIGRGAGVGLPDSLVSVAVMKTAEAAAGLCRVHLDYLSVNAIVVKVKSAASDSFKAGGRLGLYFDLDPREFCSWVGMKWSSPCASTTMVKQRKMLRTKKPKKKPHLKGKMVKRNMIVWLSLSLNKWTCQIFCFVLGVLKQIEAVCSEESCYYWYH